MDEVGEAAVAYAHRGWVVVPLHGIDDGVCTCREGAACSSPGKHPLWDKWERLASADPGTVEGWWRSFTGPRNVGIVCGPSGIAVIDVDGEKGEETIRSLGLRLAGPIVLTGRGRHIYVDGAGVVATKLPGVDIKAGVGYVVAPPSLHVSGVRYRWDEGL